MRIEFWVKNGKGAPDASLLLTNDRFFAVKGLPIEKGREVRPLTDAHVDYVLFSGYWKGVF